MVLNLTVWQDQTSHATAWFPVARVYLPKFVLFTAVTLLASFPGPSVSLGDFLSFNVYSIAYSIAYSIYCAIYCPN